MNPFIGMSRDVGRYHSEVKRALSGFHLANMDDKLNKESTSMALGLRAGGRNSASWASICIPSWGRRVQRPRLTD